MFLHEAKHLFFLLRSRIPTTLKEVFSRCNCSDNLQLPSSMHSNVQLLYLLLFFAVVAGVAVLIA